MTEKVLRRLRVAILTCIALFVVAPLVYIVVDIKFSSRGWWEPGPVARFFNENLERAAKWSYQALARLYHLAGIDASYAELAALLTLFVVSLCVWVIALRLKKRSGQRVRASAKAWWHGRT